MAAITTSVLIHAPTATVWESVADLASHATWMSDVASIHFDSPEKQGVGTRMLVDTRVGPLRTKDVLEVTEWEEGRLISVEHIGLVSGSGRFELAAEGDATRFTWNETLSFPARLGGPVTAWLARPVLTAIWRRNLERLKARIEG